MAEHHTAWAPSFQTPLEKLVPFWWCGLLQRLRKKHKKNQCNQKKKRHTVSGKNKVVKKKTPILSSKRNQLLPWPYASLPNTAFFKANLIFIWLHNHIVTAMAPFSPISKLCISVGLCGQWGLRRIVWIPVNIDVCAAVMCACNEVHVCL